VRLHRSDPSDSALEGRNGRAKNGFRMFERELKRFRSLVRERQYILTIHALEEVGEDDVFDEDIENVILTGQIVERQVDCATREQQYVFTGMDRAGEPVGVGLKRGSTGKAVVITG
jgi:hypothetical protein